MIVRNFVTIVAAVLVGTSTIQASYAQSPFRLAMQSYSGNDADPDTFEGFTEPYRDIQLGSADTGTISEIRVEEGRSVQFGQVVAKLEDRVYQANVAVARQAASATGELEAAKVQLENSQRRYEQMAALHGRNHASDQELLAVVSAHDEAKARVKAYQELNARRQQELKQAEAQLARMTIVSPIDGIVVKCFKDVGEVVSPADPTLVRIIQLDPLRISATATIEQSRRLRTGQSLVVKVNGTEKTAVVEFVSPVADVSSSTTQVQLRIANSDLQLFAGMPCRIQLSHGESKPESIPRQTRVPTDSERFK